MTTKKQPKERTSVFLDAGSLGTAAQVAALQSAANPHRDAVTVSAVMREAITLGLQQLLQRYSTPASSQ
ncbi:hypothetical protein ACG04R_16320 [Roseateles sp. BYS78W]|uniref:Uncharacterized protein n=1 Tax=Pelomonas candidula TaxID=3299025 RepID=A0ABW7HF03_9BURK